MAKRGLHPVDYKAYEQFVADVVRSMSFSDKAKVYTNRRYPGVRQPGTYEIDVSCEVWFDDSLFFLIVVECKNWNRPIDRPIVQKLIQTRDAISAHKAAFASPIGYTKEAIQVAEANGVALWVLAEGTFDVEAGGGLAALSLCFRLSDSLRSLAYEAVNYNHIYQSNLPWFYDPQSGRPNLIPIDWLPPVAEIAQEPCPPYRAIDRYATAYDPIVADLIRYALAAEPGANSLTKALHAEIARIRQVLRNAGLDAAREAAFLDEFVIPMVTEGISIPKLFDRLESFDDSVPHCGTDLVAPISWIEKHGRDYCIYTDKDDDSFLSLNNNIVWANAAWLLSRSDGSTRPMQ